MKKLLFVVLFLSSAAYACQEESQFIAQIKSASMIDGQCILNVSSFSHYTASMVCPLWESDVLSQGITTDLASAECSKMNGGEISGYLIRPIGSNAIFLD